MFNTNVQNSYYQFEVKAKTRWKL